MKFINKHLNMTGKVFLYLIICNLFFMNTILNEVTSLWRDDIKIMVFMIAVVFVIGIFMFGRKEKDSEGEKSQKER